jgi:hypothetical protein
MGTIACGLLVAFASQKVWSPSPSAAVSEPIVAEDSARIVQISNVEWADGAQHYDEWSVLGPGATVNFKSGRINLFVSNGAELLIEGPADVRFDSSQKIFARKGKLAARIGPGAIGFRIDTPHANVTDRGTEFGVSVEDDSHTSVVVYKGIVDLDVVGGAEQPRQRLETGEALSVNREGQLSRITTVASSEFLEPPQVRRAGSGQNRLITSVSDNVRSLNTTKYYRVIPRGFREDCQAYVDRPHEWNGVDARGLPPFLLGGDYVMTFNDDKITKAIEISIEISQPANVYVLFDHRVSPPPDWLTRDFEDTKWNVGCDDVFEDKGIHIGVGAGQSIDQVFSVWRRRLTSPTTVLLGALLKDPPSDIKTPVSMYGVVVTPIRGGRTR